MPRKRRSVLDEPAASSSEDEAVSGSEPEASRPPKTAAKPQFSSSGETGTESDKPIASKPMEEVTPPPKATKRRSKPPASPATAKSGTKRPPGGESELSKHCKKAKKKGDDQEEEASKKSKLFQRLWSDEDEVVILNGMSEYATKKGVDPYADMAAFHEFIKKSLNVDVSKSQLQDKIRRMKKKFENNVKSKHKPTKPHDLETLELSKKVWGGGGEVLGGLPKKVVGGGEDLAGLVTIASYGNAEQPKANGKTLSSPEPSKGDEKSEVFLRQCVSGCVSSVVIGFDEGFQKMGLSESIVQQGLELIGELKCAELRDRWRELHVIELELFVRRTELMRNQAKMMLDAFKSGH